MKKQLLALALTAALTLAGSVTALAEEYVMTPGDRVQIFVQGEKEISSNPANDDSAYVVMPDGMLDFPLVGAINTTDLTVDEFKFELTNRLKEYIKDPRVTINIAKLGTTRVFVLGEINKQGSYELTKGHRVLDALGAAGGFNAYSAKKHIYLIRNIADNPDAKDVVKVNINDYLRKGDHSQNMVLHEGDCLYLTSNGKVDFLNTILRSAYYADTIHERHK